uniref:Retrotransposable element Tf2 155 kDa protein type 2 n=1 Tax=Bactrocera dorsalis TaxID=27457 RepID=A0A034WN84_BACDO
MHKVVVPMLSKLCTETPTNWYKHIDRVQQFINNTPPRSTKQTPFKILTGLDMCMANMPELQELLDDEAVDELNEDRELVRKQARENISQIQQENRRSYNLRRRKETSYEPNDLVAIKRTQFGSGLKLKPKFLGPYRVVKKFNHGRYEVEKVGDHEGPGKTSTVAEYMKRWTNSFGGE